MSSEIFAFNLRYWRNLQTTTTQVQVRDVATAQEIQLSAGSLTVRVWLDGEPASTRCSIRHSDSGQEIFLQSGAGLSDFIKAYLLANPDEPGLSASDSNSTEA